MRQSVFRGKSIKSNKWIYGLLWRKRPDSPKDIFISFYDYDNDSEDAIRVLENTVGQYSGVDDKNGVPMYEGDIIKGAIHWLERYVLAWVGFQDGSFGLFWKRGDVVEFNPFTSLCNVTYEVVGNIYDNDIDKMGADYDFI